MKRIAILPLFFFATFCAGSHAGQTSSNALQGHGAISIEVAPNPIVAHQVRGDTYDFPFDVVVRETGGHRVDITRVSADVYALGGLRVTSESYDAARIRGLGYSTTLPAGGELRYHFAPRESVGDDRLFGSISANLHADAIDDRGTATTAETTVTIRR
jgi:hypothetical protein